jgi:vitamin B12 transporter
MGRVPVTWRWSAVLSVASVTPLVACVTEQVPPRMSMVNAPGDAGAPRDRGAPLEEHEVHLSIDVGADAKVTRVEVIGSDDPTYEAAAINAAKRAVFKPAIRDGIAVPSRVPWTFRFRLMPAD